MQTIYIPINMLVGYVSGPFCLRTIVNTGYFDTSMLPKLLN